jgi:hypothetical protein
LSHGAGNNQVIDSSACLEILTTKALKVNLDHVIRAGKMEINHETLANDSHLENI